MTVQAARPTQRINKYNEIAALHQWSHFSFHVVIHLPDLFGLKVEANSAFSLADSLEANSI